MVILYFLAGGMTMLIGIYFGLKWQMQTAKGEIITLPEIQLPTKEKQEPMITPELVQEWFEGPPKKEGET